MGWLMRLGTLAMLPSKVVEEVSHAAAAWPWASELALVVRPGEGHAGVFVQLDDAPPWVEGVIHHAPKIAGVVLAAAAIVAVASGVRPEAPLELAGAVALAGWWAKLVAPEGSPKTTDQEAETNG